MKELVIKFKSEMESIVNLRNMITSLVVNKNQTLNFMNELKTIVSEAVTNAIIHAYDAKDDEDIMIKVATDQNGIYLEITDFGKGIKDIEEAREVLFSTKKDEERSGLGFTILELFSTNFEISSVINEGTTLSIYKEWE